MSVGTENGIESRRGKWKVVMVKYKLEITVMIDEVNFENACRLWPTKS